jgi:hypothetical protein
VKNNSFNKCNIEAMWYVTAGSLKIRDFWGKRLFFTFTFIYATKSSTIV